MTSTVSASTIATQLPEVQTSCPAANKARAAVMPTTSSSGNKPVLYYVNHATNTIEKYDTTTGMVTHIVTATNILGTQVSADGQWIAFIQRRGAQQMVLQLVRTDGQELQTLYCTDHPFSPVLSWSPDQKYLVFSQFMLKQPTTVADQNYSVYALDTTSGELHIVLKPWQNTTGQTPEYRGFEALKWTGNRSLYLSGAVVGVGGGGRPLRYRMGFYHLKDVTLDSSKETTNLQPISLPAQMKDIENVDFDTNQDGSQLVFSTATFHESDGTNRGPSVIVSQPGDSGTTTVVHQDNKNAITYVRFLPDGSLMFVINNADYSFSGEMPADFHKYDGLWKVNADGSGLTRLTTNTQGSSIYLPLRGYAPWTNISRDGSLYAIAVTSIQNTTQSLLFGSFHGGEPKTFLTVKGDANTLEIIGWATA